MLWPSRLLYLGVVAGGFGLARAGGAPVLQALLLGVLPVVLIDGALRHVCRRQLRVFNRLLVATMQRQEGDRLLPLYRQQWLLRFFGPRHVMLGYLGLIYRRTGNLQGSAVAYRAALDLAPRQEVLLLAHKLADALYALGDHAGAERYYRMSQTEQHVNAGVRARLARLVLERGGDEEEAEQLMRQAVAAAQGEAACGPLRCQLVQQLAERGKLDDARQHLQLAETEMANAADDERSQLAVARAALNGATGALGATGAPPAPGAAGGTGANG